MLLYKYHNTPQLTAYSDGPAGKNAKAIQKALDDWNSKTWHHYAMCWTPDQITLYVDGEEAGQSSRAEPVAEDWKYFTIGRDGFTPEGGHCAFDELRLYDKPLTPEQVSALFAAGGSVKKKVK